MPNTLNLNRNEVINSVAIRNATNSDPKVEDSTVFCLLEYHSKRAEFPKRIIPVWDRLVILSPPWSMSTKQFDWALFPRGIGAFDG